MDAAEALFFAHPFWSWIAIGGIFLIGELMTGSGWLLWPAGAAAVVAVATRFVTLNPGADLVLFVVVALIATFVGRRLMPQPAKGERDINALAPRLVGQQGESIGDFKAGVGRVFVDGKEWAAELEGGGDLAPKAKVEVLQILGGARLKVRAA